MAGEDFDPAEVGVQSVSSCCGIMSSVAMLYAAYQVPAPMNIKAFGGAAVGILVLCLCCCLSMNYGAQRTANYLPGQG